MTIQKFKPGYVQRSLEEKAQISEDGFPISVLDLSPISSGVPESQALYNSISLAQFVDRLGYRRYWVAEHHSIPSVASSAPEMLIAHAAMLTSRIRVGSGGIMLPNHAPLRIAESFKVLEALHPGRIDLGVGRAPGSNPITALAMRRSKERLESDHFPEELAELIGLASGRLPQDHPFATVRAIPTDVSLPPIWILGSTRDGALIAAEFGLGFAFAHHINPHEAQIATETYCTHFRASAWLDRPRIIVAASVICADTNTEAERLAKTVELAWVRLRTGKPAPLSSPEEAAEYSYNAWELELARASRAVYFVGDPTNISERLLHLAAQAHADEIMVTTNIFGHAERLRSYELLAEAFHLVPEPAIAGH
ncbi:MAG: LLM class flavin-dependent oxidoreductase [Verrucomicrobia bacterium]|nr:LLM class flavin-dependent oxidoreductase [Verrucomicrobiota bacterium]